MLLVAVPRQVSSFRLLTLSCRYGILFGSDCNNNTLRDVIGVKRGDTVGLTNQGAEHLTVVDVAPSRHEIERRIAAVAAGRFRRPVMVLGIDGAYVPTRPDSAREPCEGRRGTRA